MANNEEGEPSRTHVYANGYNVDAIVASKPAILHPDTRARIEAVAASRKYNTRKKATRAATNREKHNKTIVDNVSIDWLCLNYQEMPFNRTWIP